MKIRHGSLAYLAVATALLAGGMAARAASVTVTATFDGSQPNTVGVNLTSNYNDGYHVTPTTVGTVAGIYNFTASSVTGPNPPSGDIAAALNFNTTTNLPTGTFGAVCIDFAHNIYYGQTATWTVEDLASVTSATNGVGVSTNQANAIAWLWQQGAGALGAAGPNVLSDTPSQDAAFQMAVWDLVYDGDLYSTASPKPTVSYSGIDPNISADAGAWAAEAWLATDSGANAPAGITVYALVATTGTQSFNFAIIGGPDIPPPGPVAGGGGGGL